jgi:hypothetical protein
MQIVDVLRNVVVAGYRLGVLRADIIRNHLASPPEIVSSTATVCPVCYNI